jgi:hypothetical protein
MTALTRVETYRHQAQIRTSAKLAHDGDAKQSGEYRIPIRSAMSTRGSFDIEELNFAQNGSLAKNEGD